MQDDELMARAVAVGEQGRRTAPPNPWVGCVIARDGAVVGEGFHAAPGEAHAEVVALDAAGGQARGATVYTTLEPCSHVGRTSPCTDALLAAGVTTVVTAVEDPDDRVRGTGIARLRDAGVQVVVGPGAAGAERSLAPYLHHRRTGRALCLAKVATSLDGRLAAADGTSQWITGADARRDAHELRAECQAIVVGANTAIEDEPTLGIRDVADPLARPPLRVVLDARGRVPAAGPLFDPTLGPTLVVTAAGVSDGATSAWLSAGAEVAVVARADDGRGVAIDAVLELLGGRDVLQAMFEGGAEVLGSLARHGLVDRLVLYLAPTMLGTDGRPAIDWVGPGTLARAPRLALDASRAVGDDVRLDLSRHDLFERVAA